jgi:hypothetical protein
VKEASVKAIEGRFGLSYKRKKVGILSK